MHTFYGSDTKRIKKRYLNNSYGIVRTHMDGVSFLYICDPYQGHYYIVRLEIMKRLMCPIKMCIPN